MITAFKFVDSRNSPVIAMTGEILKSAFDAMKSTGIGFCANFKFNNSAIFSEDNYNNG